MSVGAYVLVVVMRIVFRLVDGVDRLDGVDRNTSISV